MKNIPVVFILVLCATVTRPIPVASQETKRDAWESLKAVPPGDELVIDLKSGESLKGRLRNFSDDALTIARRNKTTDITRTDARRIYRLIPKSARKATLIGVAAGGGIGAIVGGVYSRGGEPGENWPILALGGIGAGIGAVVGYFSGSGKDKVLIYETN